MIKLFLFGIVVAGGLMATVVPRYSLEELAGSADAIAEGRVMESWSAWDASHTYIWTHYRVQVTDDIKGAGRELVVSEPGGTVGDEGLTVADAVAYVPGEQVIVFARRVPNGLWRTVGYGQGKYLVRNGRVQNRGRGKGIAATGEARGGSSVESLNGLTSVQFKARIRSALPLR